MRIRNDFQRDPINGWQKTGEPSARTFGAASNLSNVMSPALSSEMPGELRIDTALDQRRSQAPGVVNELQMAVFRKVLPHEAHGEPFREAPVETGIQPGVRRDCSTS